MQNRLYACGLLFFAGLSIFTVEAHSSEISAVGTAGVVRTPVAAQRLADTIDHYVAEHWKGETVQPAPLADDAEFLRRCFLDLTGRIPTPQDVHAFLADPRPDKRAKLIDRLLASPRHAMHFANLWRAILLPEVDADDNAKFFQTGFEAWLYRQFRSRVGYDKLAYELLTVPISSDDKAAQAVFSHPDQANPLAFYAAKSAQPENLAAATSRIFLGVQLECAQCHDHPFAAWTQDQFWMQSAFFAGIERQGSSLFAPLTERPDRHELIPPESQDVVQAKFLDNQQPQWQPATSPRVALAKWITAPENPYFARAAANRVWGQLFGIGIVEPVDDFRDEHSPTHPELLAALTREFVASGFDIDFLVQAICLSQTYQRTSATTHPSQEPQHHFAKMSVRRLSGEQFYDSLALATGARNSREQGPFNRNRNSPRERFLSQFAPQGKVSEPDTSIIQALILMNGQVLNDATTPGDGAMLTAIIELPLLENSDRIEAMYVATLSRKPTSSELERILHFISHQNEATHAEKLADVFWMLLNSAEFRLNH